MSTFILSLFLSLSFVMASSKSQHVLYNQDGNFVPGTILVLKETKENSDMVAVRFDKYLSPMNLSQRSEKVNREKLIVEVESISAQIHNQNKTLKKGMIILTSEKKPALIEAVFPNGKVILQKLEINSNSRFRLQQNKSFAPKRQTNLDIVDATSIQAVEQDCFLGKYCKGKTFKEIEGVPLCQSKALQDKGQRGLVQCGRRNETPIGGVFSDGTLLLHTTLINPFPKSTLKYYPEDPSVPTDK